MNMNDPEFHEVILASDVAHAVLRSEIFSYDIDVEDKDGMTELTFENVDDFKAFNNAVAIHMQEAADKAAEPAPAPAPAPEVHPRTKSALYALAERDFEKAVGELWDAELDMGSTPEHVEVLRAVRDMRDAEFMIIANTEAMKRAVERYTKALAAHHATKP